jgi:cation transport regulator ChaB
MRERKEATRKAYEEAFESAWKAYVEAAAKTGGGLEVR